MKQNTSETTPPAHMAGDRAKLCNFVSISGVMSENQWFKSGQPHHDPLARLFGPSEESRFCLPPFSLKQSCITLLGPRKLCVRFYSLPMIVLLARRSIGLIIVLAAASKLWNMSDFTASLMRLTFVPTWLAFAVATIVIVTEFTLGLFLMVAPRRREACLYGSALCASFIIVHVIAAVRNTAPCGCFGSIEIGWLAALLDNHWFMAVSSLVAFVLFLMKDNKSHSAVIFTETER